MRRENLSPEWQQRTECPARGGKVVVATHEPSHPGELIRKWILEPTGMSSRYLAARLGVGDAALTRVLAGEEPVSPDLALRLSVALGRSAEEWLWLQCRFDLGKARHTAVLDGVTCLPVFEE